MTVGDIKCCVMEDTLIGSIYKSPHISHRLMQGRVFYAEKRTSRRFILRMKFGLMLQLILLERIR